MSLVGPKKSPVLKVGDFHLVANGKSGLIKCYDHVGDLKWTKSVLAKGWAGPSTHVTGGDTPPGLYILGTLYISKPWEPRKIWAAYGKYCYDMEEQENQENKRGRAGISVHSGGSGLSKPLAPYQPLTHTSGCLRMHNKTMREFVVPLTHRIVMGMHIRKKNTVYISVYQDHDK